MSERYNRVFVERDRKYCQTSPIMIEACALLYDKKTKKTVAQVKFKSISAEVIKAVYIKGKLYDISGDYIGEFEDQFLDLEVVRDQEFGQKHAIPLNNNSARSIKLFVEKIVFQNGEVWNSEEKDWDLYPNRCSITEKLNASQKRIYQARVNTEAKYYPNDFLGCWECTCGALNRDGEKACHLCAAQKIDVFSFLNTKYLNNEYKYLKAVHYARSNDPETIKKATPLFNEILQWKDSKEWVEKIDKLIEKVNKDNTYSEANDLAEEGSPESLEEAISLLETIADWRDAEERIVDYKNELMLMEEEEQEIRLRKKKLKRNFIIIVALLAITIAAVFFIKNVVFPELDRRAAYNEAITLFKEEKYNEAEKAFIDLKDYKDSEKYSKQSRIKILQNKYDTAIDLMEKGAYKKAITAFQELGDYSDSSEKVKECKYKIGLNLMKDKKYSEAKDEFEELGDYLDSSEKAKECIYQSGRQFFAKRAYDKAYELFKSISDYKKASRYMEKLVLVPVEIDYESSYSWKYYFDYTKEGLMKSAREEGENFDAHWGFNNKGILITEKRSSFIDGGTRKYITYDDGTVKSDVYEYDKYGNRTSSVKRNLDYTKKMDKHHNPIGDNITNNYDDDGYLLEITKSYDSYVYQKSTIRYKRIYLNGKNKVNNDLIWKNIRIIAGDSIWY